MKKHYTNDIRNVNLKEKNNWKLNSKIVKEIGKQRNIGKMEGK